MSAAAVAGSVAQTILNRSKDSTKRKIAEGVAGALAGIWFGPGLADAFEVHRETFRLAISFATGAVGITLLTLLIDGVKSERFKEWLLNKKPPT